MAIMAYEFIENSLPNMLWNENDGIATKTWKGGLSKYVQSNCSCTLTDRGYRIYRTPNVNPTDNGNTMWGGFVIRNTDNQFNVNSTYNNRYGFIKGHTYVIAFDIEGISSNAAPDIYWTNGVGWGGGGLNCNPSNVELCVTEADFNGKKTCFYKWTLSDDIVKTCTSAYWNYVKGTQYLSYAGFKFGWQYTDTGSMGTDVYITNLRMYDITNILNWKDLIHINKNGIIDCENISEVNDLTKFNMTGEITSPNFIEI